MKKTILAITFIISLAGCSREYNCTNENLHLSFIGFSKSDIDTLVIKKYTAHNNFQQLINTVQFAIDTTGILQTNDTISFGGAAINNIIQYGNDWQIVIPSKNITVTISNIISPQEQRKCSVGGKVNCLCYNTIQSVMQDGQVINNLPQDLPFDGYKIFIHN